ncbi:MAG TPA: alkaline phosphatase family protein [Vicinamibacterales bacterium]|nr:alkaline phosphatase family protein [Vicinamibacterales bacterium]
MAGGPDPRVDELREHLRALGYLDARVDRFVLGGAARRRGPAALALAASARIGVLAGVLLGPAAAIGLRVRLPGLVTSATDAVVLACYLAAFFGLAAGALSFVSILIAGQLARRPAAAPAFARRATRVGTVAGLVVAATCLAYLTLWWRAALAAADSTSLGWTAAAVGVAVAISLLLGHAVRITVLAYLARVGGSDVITELALPQSTWKATLPFGVLAFAGAMTLLFVTSGGGVPAEGSPLTVVSTNLRVDVIAIDGIDTGMLDRLIAAGRLPVLNRLLGQSVAAIAPEPDRDPAKVWTTVATGQPPDRHGIRGLESRQVAGVEGQFRSESGAWSALTAATDLVRLTRPAIASGEQRLIPAFWEVAARAGLRTAVIHWWATWPAPDDLGVVISDRAILRLEAGGPQDREIAPASLYRSLAETWPARRSRAQAKAAHAAAPGVSGDIAAVVERAATLDATLIDLATDPALGSLDLRVVYLPGLDIVQHSLFSAIDQGTLAPSGAAERLQALEQYYVFLDADLGELVGPAAGPGRLIVLVTEPGRVSSPTAGVLALTGTAASTTRTNGADTAIAPTILYALGVPMARELASRPALDLFLPAFTAAHPLREVSTYGSRRLAPQPVAGRPLDKEMIDRMRSLGYIR